MNLYHLSILEHILKNAAIGFASCPFMDIAVNYDQRSLINDYLRTTHLLYHDLFLKTGFLDENTNYCISEFTEMLDISSITEHQILNVTLHQLKTMELPPPRGFFSIVPVHTRISVPDSFILLTGVVGKEVDKNLVILVGKEISVDKNDINYIVPKYNHLKELLISYHPKQYGSLREYAQVKNIPYNKFNQDFKECFNCSFSKVHLLLRQSSVLYDVLFTSSSLKEIAYLNDFENYNRMYESFSRIGIIPSDIPRFNI